MLIDARSILRTKRDGGELSEEEIRFFITEVEMKDRPIADIIDLDRYPLDRPDGSQRRTLLADGRESLDNWALYSLPGFIQPAAVAAMASELDGLLPGSCRYDQPRIAYDYDDTDTETGEFLDAALGEPVRVRFNLVRRDCTAVKITITDNGGAQTGEGPSLTSIGMEIQKLPTPYQPPTADEKTLA